MSGNLTRRGKNSWRLKFDLDRDPAGKRVTQVVTVRGTRKQAQVELTRLMASQNDGSFVEPSKLTVADYMRDWIATAETLKISPKTAERYRQLIEGQIIPGLGGHVLQKLKASHITQWHATLVRGGGRDGGPLAARTVGHCHRVLRKAMADALAGELLLRNPAAAVQPPTVADVEVEILKPEQVKEVLAAMRETSIYPHVVVLLATGMRRGELIGLQWDDLDLDSKMVKIVRSVEKTKAKAKGQPCSLRIKAPKTKAGRRQITLPEAAVAVLREHKKALLELRLRLGLGRLLGTAFVFGTPEGQPRDPDRITQDWKRFTAARNLPKVKLHALRHTHASALIAAHHDIVTISRRLGHYSPVVTLSIYAHLFENKGDGAAAQSMNAVFAP